MDIILNGKIEPVEVGFDNLEELQEYVDLDTKSVETVIVTPDNLKSCRQMRAYYNGQAKLIHENMRAFQAAYESDFNKKIKKLFIKHMLFEIFISQTIKFVLYW